MKLSKEAKSFLDSHKNQNIVFTNGCFDILHRGHLTYLQQARELGDVLFIGLNSDQSVKRLKGESRPVNSEADRKFMLESLRFVDFVEIFEDDTPLELIKQVRPNTLVKGGDWKASQIVGSDFVLSTGGKVQSLSFVDGHSTTSIIEKIKS
jgi:rfaE bifunctional protein nucleotidyltransferase chain/domain